MQQQHQEDFIHDAWQENCQAASSLFILSVLTVDCMVNWSSHEMIISNITKSEPALQFVLAIKYHFGGKSCAIQHFTKMVLVCNIVYCECCIC